MAIIKSAKIREMSDSELEGKLFEFQKELNSERGVVAAGGRSSNPGKVRELRRAVSRVMTIMHERKIGIVRKAKAVAPKQEASAAKVSGGKNVG